LATFTALPSRTPFPLWPGIHGPYTRHFVVSTELPANSSYITRGHVFRLRIVNDSVADVPQLPAASAARA
jgi:hypothetical protein